VDRILGRGRHRKTVRRWFSDFAPDAV